MHLISIAFKYLRIYGIKEVSHKTVSFIVNMILNKYTVKKVIHTNIEYGLSEEAREVPVIVSLTSFPSRFKDINLCLKSLLLQEVKPDRIIVYLGSDTAEEDITTDMREFEKYGVEYRIDSNYNLKPHKKYYYAMQEYANAIIVTADDDIIYPRTWLKKLIDTHKKYPSSVCGWRVHKIEFDEEGNIKPYEQWKSQYRKCTEPNMDLVATGGAGALYPPCALDKQAFDIKKIEKLCLNADDLWLKCMEVLQNTTVVWVKNYQVTLPGTVKHQDIALNISNVSGGMNDSQLNAVMKAYNMNSLMFKNKSWI